MIGILLYEGETRGERESSPKSHWGIHSFIGVSFLKLGQGFLAESASIPTLALYTSQQLLFPSVALTHLAKDFTIKKVRESDVL